MTTSDPSAPAHALPADGTAPHQAGAGNGAGAAAALPEDSPDSRFFVDSRGIRIDVWEWGAVESAEFLIVGAHGFLDSTAFLAPLARLLVRDPRVAVRVLSFAGHGDSSWADTYDWYDHTIDTLAVVRGARESCPDVPLFVMGHSFGGVQMLEVAATLGPDIAGVINLDAVYDAARGGPADMLGSMRQLLPQERETRPSRVYASVDDLVKRRAANNPRLSLDTLRYLIPSLASPMPGGGWAWKTDPLLMGWVRPWHLAGAAPRDAIATMRALDVPVLLISGAAEDHPLVRGPYPGDAALRIPGIIHTRLEDAGHYVHLEQTAAVAAAIEEFMGCR
jgi:pimeloyl-ACP methyl ester carboxylesterase